MRVTDIPPEQETREARGRDLNDRSPVRCSDKELYKTLSNIRRRYVIYYVKRSDAPVAFEELVDQIATWENPGDANGITRSQRKSIHNALRQTHLPKLQQTELIDYDPDTAVLTPGEEATRVSLYPASETSFWGVGYSLLSAAIVVSVALDVFWSDLVTLQFETAWVAGSLATVILLTLGYNYDWYRRRRLFRNAGPDVIVHQIDE